MATPLPFVYQENSNRLISHLARMNPQWEQLDPSQVLVVFSGPHAYISPTWYEEKNSVPTWNYVNVQVYGQMNVIEDHAEAEQILTDTVRYYESNQQQPWSSDLKSEYHQSLLKHIVPIEIKINRMEGAWKLHQHHSDEKKRKVIHRLLQQEDDNSKEIARLMSESLGT